MQNLQNDHFLWYILEKPKVKFLYLVGLNIVPFEPPILLVCASVVNFVSLSMCLPVVSYATFF